METGGSIVEPKELANLVKSKACNFHRGVSSHTCPNPEACGKILEASRYLGNLARFEGTDKGGRSVTGYIVED